MIGRDGAAELRPRAAHEIDALLGGQVLQDHPQAGERLDQRDQLALDERGLAVEDVDIGVDVLAMHEERHVDLFHAFEHAVHLLEVGHAGGGIGGGVGGIELDAGEHALAKAALDVVGVGVVAQIAGHQRREGRAGRARRQRTLAIGDGVLRGHDRRDEIRHQDGAAEMARGERHHRREHGAVAQMQVPVVGLAYGEAHFAVTFLKCGGPRTDDGGQRTRVRNEKIGRTWAIIGSAPPSSAVCHPSSAHPIGAAAAAKVSIGASSIMAPVRSATRAKPRLPHHSSSPSRIAIRPDGLRKMM